MVGPGETDAREGVHSGSQVRASRSGILIATTDEVLEDLRCCLYGCQRHIAMLVRRVLGLRSIFTVLVPRRFPTSILLCRLPTHQQF